MIIASKDIDMDFISKNVGFPEDIMNYAISLVPTWARHIPGIVENQRYYVAVRIRNNLAIPYKLRIALCERLIENITLSGMVTDFITIYEILDLCNKDKLYEALVWRNRQ